METPDLASMTDKGCTGGCSLKDSPMDSAMEQVWTVVSPTSRPLARPPLLWETHTHRKKEGLVVDVLITLISEMGIPALTEVK